MIFVVFVSLYGDANCVIPVFCNLEVKIYGKFSFA